MTNDKPGWMELGGRRMRGRRTDLGLSIDEVARECGVAASTVSRWENGDRDPMRGGSTLELQRALRLRSFSRLYLEGELEEA